LTVVKVPIACSLAVDDSEERIREWRTFLRDSVVSAERRGYVLRLGLEKSDHVLLTAVDLASREKACCPFFEFSVEIEPTARTFRVEVPPDAGQVLDDLAALLPSDGEE
jgi:hypothetical protein